MRFLLGLTILALCATPALAGNKGKHEKNIANLQDKIDRVLVTPSDNRREQLDRLEQKLGYNLFKLQQQGN